MSRKRVSKERPVAAEVGRLVMIKVMAAEIARWVVDKISPYLPF